MGDDRSCLSAGIGHRESKGLHMQFWVALLIALSLNAAANLMMKLGAQAAQASGGLTQGGVTGAIRNLVTNGQLMMGLACFALNALFYLYARPGGAQTIRSSS